MPILITLYLGSIVTYGLNSRGSRSDICVVFGSKVNPDGTVSHRLKARLDKAIELYHHHYCQIIITSGGIGKEGYDEALVMQDYLITNRIPLHSIHADSSGVNTLATTQFIHQYCKEKNLTSVIGVSQYFHLLRIRLTFQRLGLQSVTTEAPIFWELRDAFSILREAVAIPVYTLKLTLDP